MSTIQVTICGELRELEAGLTLHQAIEQFTPYGNEAVICKYNGRTVCSIDPEQGQTLCGGDVLEIYPLIIGG